MDVINTSGYPSGLEQETYLFLVAATNSKQPFMSSMAIALDVITKVAKGKFTVYSWVIGNSAGQKPAGNTLQDNSFIGLTIDQIGAIAIDNQFLNNISAQGIALDNAPNPSLTGTFDLSAIGGLKAGGPSGISIYLNTVKNLS